MTRDSDRPIYDRRTLPSPFVPRWPVTPALRAMIEARARADGDDPADLLADALMLGADELEGEVFDERELGFAADPCSPEQPWHAPGPPEPDKPEPAPPGSAKQGGGGA